MHRKQANKKNSKILLCSSFHYLKRQFKMNTTETIIEKVVVEKIKKLTKAEIAKALKAKIEADKKAIDDAKIQADKKAKIEADKVKKTKAEIAEKRKLNPQFAHVVSKQQKADFLNFKSDGLKVLLSAKKIVANIEIEGYSLAENINNIQKSISFINFVTKSDKSGNFTNEILLKNLVGAVRVTKSGLYSEYCFAQLVQKIVNLSIKKGYDYATALNVAIAQNEKSKKDKK